MVLPRTFLWISLPGIGIIDETHTSWISARLKMTDGKKGEDRVAAQEEIFPPCCRIHDDPSASFRKSWIFGQESAAAFAFSGGMPPRSSIMPPGR